MKMGWVGTAIFVAESMLAAPASADACRDLLQALGGKLVEIRQSKATERIALEPLINIDALKGCATQDVFEQLGRPDNCTLQVGNRCSELSLWSYLFVHMPAGWRGGGPQLNLSLNQKGVVQEAWWTLSR